MDEMMEMTVSDTAPQVDETDSIAAGGAPVDDETVLMSDGEDTTPPPEAQKTASEGTGEIVYRFNHETRTLPSEDAPQFIQKLLKTKYDYEHKVMPQLDRLRALTGAREEDLPAVVERLEKVCEEAEYQHFLEVSGGNETIARGLTEAARRTRAAQSTTTAEHGERAEADAADEAVRRMGEQLQQLQEEFPEIGDFCDLPESVVQEANEQRVTLLDGYLRYLYRNSRRAAAEKSAEEKAAAASAGSLRGEADDAEKADDQSSAFSAAFRSKFS